MTSLSVTNFLLALVLAPILLGVINKIKAFFAGRKGQPILQAYFDLWKLLHKGAVYSTGTTWIFRAGPAVGLACAVVAAALMPLGTIPALISFPCDLILFAYVFGVMRFFTVLAALDTGSAFEGMGASREVQFSAMAEPALLLGLAAMARLTGSYSLSDVFSGEFSGVNTSFGPVIFLVALSILIVLLTENARIPVDDPNTHLELTMIHEVMVLDHSGPDFAYILYGAALKLWVMGTLLVNVVLPVRTDSPVLNIVVALGGMLCVAILVGVIESSMARLRLLKVPSMLVGAVILAGLAFVLLLR